ncbi:MAG: GNAT family N-acetyltransferase [Tannerellaceae bacterium]|jgi:RimJ/RimL family protein N-acetyltransferase|nr:GNAT family N-acetyltransferase [Tannerellaceae bacterium]
MNMKICRLREWQLADASSLAEQADNFKIWLNLRDALPHPYTEEHARQFISNAAAMPRPHRLMTIDVDGKAIGSIGITPHIDVERISAELGYFIGEKYWNRGITTEAIREMTAYAFNNFPLLKIYATPFGHNIASQRALQKAGFELEAILKRAAVKNGQVVDMHYYSIFKEEPGP